MADGLKAWNRYWKLIGGVSLLHCAYCAEEQHVKTASQAFVHDPDCRRPEGCAVYPWHALAELLKELPAVPA